MIPITAYTELEGYIEAFGEGSINLLLIEGTGGTGKTVTTTKTLEKAKKKYKYVSGHLTALEFYRILYSHRNGYTFVLDDIDALLRNPIHTSLLKQLCDTKKTKVIQYHTTSSKIEDIPSEFTIHAPVIILANHISKLSDDIQALFTRGVHISFAPTPTEIVSRAKKYLGINKEIIIFAEQHLPVVTTIDLRKLVIANELYDSKKVNWKTWFTSELGINPDYEIVIGLMTEFTTFKLRSKAFRDRTGKSEATYVRYLKHLGI
jgi:hypothetical protein